MTPRLGLGRRWGRGRKGLEEGTGLRLKTAKFILEAQD